MRLITLAMALLCSLSFANDLAVDAFNKNFKIKRNDQGQAIAIKAKFASTRFDVKKYVDSIKEELKAQQQMINAKGSTFHAQLDATLSEMLDGEKSQEDIDYVIKEAMAALATVDIDGTFKQIEDSGFFSEFGDRLRAAFQSLDFTIVSKMDDARFFYQQRVTYQVVTWALNWAKKHFSQIPVLNTVSFVIVKLEKLITEQRTFYQNMMLYYLDNVDHVKLGLTKAEADHIYSSIYESRIPWASLNESNLAAANWDRYGTDKFYTGVRASNTRFRDLAWSYRSVGSKIGFTFAEVTGEKGKMIVNLTDSKHMLSSLPAVAYYYDEPQKVMKERMLINIAQVALSFVTIPDGLKNLFNTFAHSYYEKQKLTEGSLYAYLEMNGKQSQARTVVLGAINPFLVLY